MTEEIRNLLESWVKMDNGHPCDDSRLFDIVIKTMDDKLEESDFKEVSDKAFEKYSLYETLIDFAKYFRGHENNKC